ncbi:MAG: zinc ribbon domain-containing protein [Deltaproteobacteria bacterium]|nr:zinc ribbon domain-containing protein [Deltaproteobacteria bacterium]
MPEYEFFCSTCKKPFTALMHVKEHDKKVEPCPKCKKTAPVQKRISGVSVITARKS